MEKYREIKSMETFSVAKLQGLIMAVVGLFVGIIFFIMFSFFSLFAGAMGTAGNIFGLFGIGMGFGALILFPIFYGISGFVSGLLTALVYNLIAKWIGGIKIELK